MHRWEAGSGGRRPGRSNNKLGGQAGVIPAQGAEQPGRRAAQHEDGQDKILHHLGGSQSPGHAPLGASGAPSTPSTPPAAAPTPPSPTPPAPGAASHD